MIFIFTCNGITRRIIENPQSIYTDIYSTMATSVPCIKFVLADTNNNKDYSYIVPFYGKKMTTLSENELKELHAKRDEMMSLITDAYAKHKKVITLVLP